MLSGVKMVLVWYGMSRFFQPEMNSGEENLNLNKRVRNSFIWCLRTSISQVHGNTNPRFVCIIRHTLCNVKLVFKHIEFPS